MTFLQKNIPAIVLAPMEGVTDAPMRDFLTRTGFYDYCVSEFIRVSETVLNHKIFAREVPELSHQAKTRAGIGVQVQLLGGNPERLALSALAAIEAGAQGIDLNFGCPAPTVNRHDGGATLLQYPDRLETIVRAVRDAVPSKFPVSAKLRLGFNDPSVIDENVKRVEQGGASWITIHGRTKTQGYTPPAYWEPIGRVQKTLSIPVIANGEIWTIEDFKKCRNQTDCIHFMIGRSALAMPHLAQSLRQELGLSVIDVPHRLHVPETTEPSEWSLFFNLYGEVQTSEKRFKQWVRYVAHKREVTWWNEIKSLGSVKEILNRLEQFPAKNSFASPIASHLEQIEL